MGLVAKRIVDPRMLRLIRRYLEAGMSANAAPNGFPIDTGPALDLMLRYTAREQRVCAGSAGM